MRKELRKQKIQGKKLSNLALLATKEVSMKQRQRFHLSKSVDKKNQEPQQLRMKGK